MNLDASWATLSVLIDGVPNGSYPVTEAITINGEGGNDTLTVDFGGGSPTLSSFLNLTFNGDAGSDKIVLQNGAMNNVVHRFDSPAAGAVQMTAAGVSGNLAYSGLEPITDNLNVANRVFTFTNTVSNGDLTASPVTPATQTRIDSSQSESVDFTTPTSSLTVNLAAGNNTFSLTSLAANFNTPTSTINGNSGDDTFNINASALGGATVFVGNAGDDTFNVNLTSMSMITAPLTIRGGANDFGAGVGSRDEVIINDQFGLSLAPVFTYTGGGPDGSQLTVGALASLLTVETVETVDYNGSLADNDLATVVGTSGSDLITVAPITAGRALVFNNNTTDASGPFDAPPQNFATRIPGVSGGSVRPIWICPACPTSPG